MHARVQEESRTLHPRSKFSKEDMGKCSTSKGRKSAKKKPDMRPGGEKLTRNDPRTEEKSIICLFNPADILEKKHF